MIGFLSGQVHSKGDRSLVIEVQGVGYVVAVSGRVHSQAQVGSDIKLRILTVVKENAIDLYGFGSEPEQHVFELLTSISGVGPKSALNVLDAASHDEIINAVLQQDPSLLEKVSGIGKKTAERIVLELKNKIAKDLETKLFTTDGSLVEVIEALQGLGYEAAEVRDVVKDLSTDLSVEEKIKHVLQLLGK